MKQKVLIVEDNISLSQRQKDWLEQAGYDVMTAMREPAARALIRKYGHEIEMYTIEQGEKRDKRQ